MRESGWDQLPPDVRFAGKPAEMRAPPWITDCPPTTTDMGVSSLEPRF
jgi:hypothetical protein